MEIKIKKDWDTPTQYPEFEGKNQFFIGRIKEVELLARDIARNESGSILVCGHRGAGKTSLVYKALSQANKIISQADKTDKHTKLLVVFFNAGQLSTKTISGNKLALSQQILEGMIRRLYAESIHNESLKIEEKIKTSIAELYYKATSNFHEEDKITIGEKAIETSFTKTVWDYKVIWIACWTAAAVIVGLLHGDLWHFISNLLVIPIPFLIQCYRSTSSITNKQTENSAMIHYRFDNNPSNLESDLNNIHLEMIKSKNKIKIIYIIDELDSIEEEKETASLIKHFKNLFTLSKAQFIFISGERLWKEIDKKDDYQTERQISHTLFTSRYFISRPSFDELNKYIDEITLKDVTVDNESFAIFKKAVIFQSGGDFFDLTQSLKGLIDRYDANGVGIIPFQLDEVYIKRAAFQDMITVLYNEKLKRENMSAWKENEAILRTLYNACNQFIPLGSNFDRDDPHGERPEDGALRAFYKWLTQVGYFVVLDPAGNTQKIINGEVVPLYRYRCLGNIPSKIQTKINQLNTFERAFVDSFEKLCDFLRAILNSKRINEEQEQITLESFIFQYQGKYREEIRTFGLTEPPDIAPYIQQYYKLKSPPTIATQKNDIEGKTRSLDDEYRRLIKTISASFFTIFSRMFPIGSSRLNQDNNILVNGFNPVRSKIMQLPHQVFYTNNYSKQILVINGTQNDISFLYEIEFDPKKYQIILFSEAVISSKYPCIVVSDAQQFQNSFNTEITKLNIFLKNI